jgi:hypothetical protein
MRFALLIAYTLAACAHPDDPRDNSDSAEDETLPYITETIFVPYCATAECHSTFKQASDPYYSNGLVLDTVEHAQTSIATLGMIACPPPAAQDPCDLDVDPTGKAASTTMLMQALSGAQGFHIPNSSIYLRMPYDEPLPSKDIALIDQWINDGADGYIPNASTAETGSN